MPLEAWLTLVACIGQATLAFLAARSKDPLAAPLALLTADLFVWNLATLSFRLSGAPAWHVLDVTASPLTPAFGLHFVLSFVGRRRELRRLLVCVYVYFGLLSATALIATVSSLGAPSGGASASPFARALSRFALPASAWSLLFLAGVLVAASLALILLLRHYRAVPSPHERARTRLLFVALPIAAVLGATDLVHLLVPAVPELSPIGTVACALSMTVVVMRQRLFGPRLRALGLAYAVAVAALVLCSYYVIYRAFSANTAAVLLGIGALTSALLAAAREVVTTHERRRSRQRELALIGRMSAQMAHDLKNPLAAVKGAAQFLLEERRRGASIEGESDFLELIAERVDHMDRVIDTYQRAGKLEPVRRKADVRALCEAVANLQSASTRIIVAVEPAASHFRLDADLVGFALENLVRNAFEAMDDSGVVTMSARREADGAIAITIADAGRGMDARTVERAFDDFFTTKAAGSGLGLAFVRRVAEAHDGFASLTSQVGRGTVVTVRLCEDGNEA